MKIVQSNPVEMISIIKTVGLQIERKGYRSKELSCFFKLRPESF